MGSRLSPQSRFLLQASVLFAALLAIWWFVLLDPLRVYLRVATSLLISPSGAARISVDADGDWELPVRAPRNSPQAGRTILLTMSLPLFWAVVVAAPHSRRMWRALAWGTAILTAIGPPSLLLNAGYAARTVLFPATPGLVWWRFGAYLCTSVIPYILPVLLALLLHAELRQAVLHGKWPTSARSERKIKRRRAARN
jgi:hypothetical protein